MCCVNQTEALQKALQHIKVHMHECTPCNHRTEISQCFVASYCTICFIIFLINSSFRQYVHIKKYCIILDQ